MADKNLRDLFLHQLKDTYFAEKAILKALPKMMDAAQSPELKSAFGVHVEETRNQVKRLDQVFGLLGEKAEGVECKAIQGIIAEGDEIVEEFSGSEALDAGLISAAQAVEHYEITRYGTLLAWARQLGLDEAEDLIRETLIEEENTDEILSDLAEASINPEASVASDPSAKAEACRPQADGGPHPPTAARIASFLKKEERLTLCSPGGKETARLVKTLVKPAWSRSSPRTALAARKEEIGVVASLKKTGQYQTDVY